MSPTFLICVRNAAFVADFPVHCNGLNSIRATQTGLSHRKHLDMSSWFASATFPAGKVSVTKFGLWRASNV